MDQKPLKKDTILNASQLKILAQKEIELASQENPCEPMALVAALPEPVTLLTPQQRKDRVRRGMDSVILLADPAEKNDTTRGFVKAVLKVPLNHPQAQTFGIFIEVGQAAYKKLKKAFADSEEVTVDGTLANRLPLLEEAYGTKVWLREYGDHRRVVVIEAEHPLLNEGPTIGKAT